MKKQFLMAAAITAIVFTSCSKEKIETRQSNDFEEVATAKAPTGAPGIVPGANTGLLGRFEFNGNLNDASGQLAPGVSTASGRVLYTADRKGNANKAIKFNEAYGVRIFNVPLESDMSVSVWVKKGAYTKSLATQFVEGIHSFDFIQSNFMYAASYFNDVPNTNSSYVLSGAIDMNWHHLTATRDANSFKFYIDGNLVGTSPTPTGSVPPGPATEWGLGYGYNSGYVYWAGSMDDLRIYKKVLTPSEIQFLSKY